MSAERAVGGAIVFGGIAYGASVIASVLFFTGLGVGLLIVMAVAAVIAGIFAAFEVATSRPAILLPMVIGLVVPTLLAWKVPAFGLAHGLAAHVRDYQHDDGNNFGIQALIFVAGLLGALAELFAWVVIGPMLYYFIADPSGGSKKGDFGGSLSVVVVTAVILVVILASTGGLMGFAYVYTGATTW